MGWPQRLTSPDDLMATTTLAGRGGAQPAVTLRAAEMAFGRHCLWRDLDLDIKRESFWLFWGRMAPGSRPCCRSCWAWFR